MSEKTLHKSICDYLRMQYPKVLFNSDLAGSMKLTIGQAVALKSLRSNRGFPDLVIYEQRQGFGALMLEIKVDGTRLYNKHGEPATDHIREQRDCLLQLHLKGYKTGFVIGWDNAKEVIDGYLSAVNK